MSQDIPDARTHGLWVRALSFAACAGWPPGALVVAGGVDGELPKQFTGGRLDDTHVEVLDEHQDVGPGVGPADADVMEAAGGPQGDAAGLVDLVVAETVVGVGEAVGAGGGFGAGGVGGGRGGPVGQGTVGAVLVVLDGEAVQQGL
jgi:hypothetical protein